MKTFLTKLAFVGCAAALLAASVDAQSRVRSKKVRDAVMFQVFSPPTANGGGSTGGSGGVITGPAPTALSPITVDVPLP